ncbi:GntR family transcriptional regulator [Litchfieldella qijiaojingensis]|uniref:GntR family transcriptional regulator n=1 Tax=Litchfieldella qijiaojingensis TaxID=980347 RepID=A0ABQ2Z6E2_9GAMM|nr:GntR family transcriptional regulator [Halomonas qijiaojingensis]GGY06461.1 GntR family transcriptional regulator [Halomonas qijiaojingensis]
MNTKHAASFPSLRQSNLVEQVADVLTEAIIARRLEPGERLSEVQLARDMGVSRAPVREAARLLESRGLLVSRPRRGFFVRELDSDDLADVFDLRLCLERHAFQLLAARFTPEMHDALHRQVEIMCDVAKEGDDGRKIEEDLRFHRLVFEFAGNRRLLKAFDDLSHELRLCMALIGRTHADPDSIVTSHWALVEALASGEADNCRAAVDYHIGVARDYVIQGIAPPPSG